MPRLAPEYVRGRPNGYPDIVDAPEEIALIMNSPRLLLGLEGFALRIVRFVDPLAG